VELVSDLGLPGQSATTQEPASRGSHEPSWRNPGRQDREEVKTYMSTVPSERELSKDFEVSRMTARQLDAEIPTRGEGGRRPSAMP